MKKTFGRPLAAIDCLYLSVGEDWNWWLIPTRPVINMNYFEKLYTLKQLKKMKGEAPEDDDYDIDRKFIAEDRKIADVEKNVVLILSSVVIVGWFLFGRYLSQDWIQNPIK
jgi:hypothetical protein